MVSGLQECVEVEMSKQYEIWTWDEVLDRMVRRKIYPYKLQAVIWCYMHGYVNNCGRFGQCLDDRVEITEVGE